MIKFISISKGIVDLKGASKLNLIMLYTTLKNHIKDSKLEAQVYNTQLENEIGLGITTIKRLVPVLKQCGLILDITKSSISASGSILEHKCNIYKFNDDMKKDYIMVNPLYLELDMSPKAKGLGILLKSFCKNGANYCIKDDAFSNAGLDSRTIKKPYNELINAGVIKEIDDNILFDSNLFYLYNPNTTDKYHILYKIIWEYCVTKDILPPVKHNTNNGKDRALELLVTQLKGKEINLTEKCPTLPKTVTLEYFLKALCNDKHSIKKDKFVFTL